MSSEDSHCVHAKATLLCFISNVIFSLYYLPFYTLSANLFPEKASFIEAMTSLKQQTEKTK